MPLAPQAVHEDLTVARASGAHLLPLADGAALLDHDEGTFFALNSTGVLVWTLLDGTSTLRAICGDLAGALGTPLPTVLDDTLALVRDLAERGLVVDTEDRGRERHVERRIEAVQSRPSGARREFQPDPWGAVTVRSPDGTRGLGVNDRTLFELARAAIAPDRLVDEPHVPELHLVVEPARGRIPGMHALYRGGRCVLRAPGEGRMLRAALAHLGARADGSDGTVWVRARALVGRKGVTLVTGTHLEPVDLASARLGRRGYRLLDLPGAPVDVERRALVIPEVSPLLDPAGLAEIDRQFPRSPSERVLHPGAREIRHVVVVGYFGDDDRPRDPDAVAKALEALEGDAALARLALEVPVRWIYGRDDRELLGVLEELAQ